MDRVSAILVGESIGHYQAAARSVVRARSFVQRHNRDPDSRLFFSRLRFETPRLADVESERHAFRSPPELVDAVSGLATDFGWKNRGPLICLCVFRTIVYYGYGHDLKLYQPWLDEFDRLIARREEQALRLARDTHAQMVSRSTYRRGALDEYLDDHPELEE